MSSAIKEKKVQSIRASYITNTGDKKVQGRSPRRHIEAVVSKVKGKCIPGKGRSL